MPATASSISRCPAPLPVPEWRRLQVRRLAVVVPSLALATILIGAGIATLAAAPHGWLDWALLVPFSLVAAWESLLAGQMVLGFRQWLRGDRGRSPIEAIAASVEPVSSGLSRTALLVPVFEEDVDAVFAGLGAMLRSLGRLGPCNDLAVHVLSDTRDDGTAARERDAAGRMQAAMPGIALHYRRRLHNTGRKAGNIADFLDGQGRDYDFAVILDADSLMSGAAVRRLIRTMEESPRVGLLQTVSYAAGRTTLFARIQQFAVRLYAPLALRGLHHWQGPEGSYWGHNAIIRVAPFREFCRLPVLPGRPPLGGEILCHDIVEGALLVRAGWEVHLLPDFEGTWEEMPTNTLDLLRRERRWCQGNLQHMRLVGWPGLKAASRVHLLLGVVGYGIVPVSWLFTVGGAIRVLWDPTQPLGLLAGGITEDGPAAAVLLAGTLVLLVVPRGLNWFCALATRPNRDKFGGRSLVPSIALEQLFGTLLSPALSLATARFVGEILLGRAEGWGRQMRADRRVAFAEAVRHNTVQLVVGAVVLASMVAAGGWYALWMLPTAAGLCFSPWIATVSSRGDLGRLSRRWGLFTTRDDVEAPVELQELHGG